jgi:hypothetical protein
MGTCIGTSSGRFPQVLRRLTVRVMMFASLAFAELAFPSLPTHAHNDQPPVDPSCIYWELPNDGEIVIDQPGFWYYESVSPDTSYATRSSVSSDCRNYWNVGVYYADNRNVQIGGYWADDWMTDEASCFHSGVLFHVWGWNSQGYTPLGGGVLNGTWNDVIDRCQYSSAPPYGSGSDSIFSSSYSYYRISAKAYRHGGCPNGAFECAQKVKVWLYTDPPM